MLLKWTGRHDVTEAGTAEQLTPNVSCQMVRLEADVNNTGTIAWGVAPDMKIDEYGELSSGPVPTAGSAEGGTLLAGEVEFVPVGNLSDLWLDATVDGEGAAIAVYG